jgi:hypothetical protein
VDSDTWKLAQECPKTAGATVKCSTCGDAYYVVAYDDVAVGRAYGMTEVLRKAAALGFRGMTGEEVAEEIRSALGQWRRSSGMTAHHSALTWVARVAGGSGA